MKTKKSSAFTLIEIVTAMTVILILTGLVISIAGYVINKGNVTRAGSELKMLETAMSGYKADAGRYPQDLMPELKTEGITDKLQSKIHFIPKELVYEEANIFLYMELTGDREGGSSEFPDGIPEEGAKTYWTDRQPNMLKVERDANKKIIRVRYIQDPWGYPYGYSTAAMYQEQKFQKELKAGEAPERLKGDSLPGFNSETPDMWSTANSSPTTQPTSVTEKEKLWAKWVKNW
jgi:type II secretory pathway pseudopilin PulG